LSLCGVRGALRGPLLLQESVGRTRRVFMTVFPARFRSLAAHRRVRSVEQERMVYCFVGETDWDCCLSVFGAESGCCVLDERTFDRCMDD